MTLKTSAQRSLAYVHSSPMQMHHKISGVTGPKFAKLFARRRGIIVDVNAKTSL